MTQPVENSAIVRPSSFMKGSSARLPDWVIQATRSSVDPKSQFLQSEHDSFHLPLKARVFGTDLWRQTTTEDVKADSLLFLTSEPMPPYAELELRFRFRQRSIGPAAEMHALAEVVGVLPRNGDPESEESWVYARILEYRYKIPVQPRSRLVARLLARANDLLNVRPARLLRPAVQR